MSKLIVYFSYTGNTKMIANRIQEKLLVDVIELYKEDTFEKLFRRLYADEEEIEKKAKSMITAIFLRKIPLILKIIPLAVKS